MFLPDVKQEIKEAEDWKANRNELSMDRRDYDYLIENGFGRCDEICMSAKYSGEDACLCIRSLFASPAHYYSYLEDRQRKIDKTIKGIAYSALSDNGDNNG